MEGEGNFSCAPASLLSRELVKRSCLNLILLLFGGIKSPGLDSQGLETSAVRYLGVVLVIGMDSPFFVARSDRGARGGATVNHRL